MYSAITDEEVRYDAGIGWKRFLCPRCRPADGQGARKVRTLARCAASPGCSGVRVGGVAADGDVASVAVNVFVRAADNR